MGAGFAALLMALGAFRELVTYGGLLLAILPPGAFFSLALAVAAKNSIDRKRQKRQKALMPATLVTPDKP
jgi:Na+-translocating ferredoxin:NAD+ oxidoreductase RnfE subunit